MMTRLKIWARWRWNIYVLRSAAREIRWATGNSGHFLAHGEREGFLAQAEFWEEQADELEAKGC